LDFVIPTQAFERTGDRQSECSCGSFVASFALNMPRDMRELIAEIVSSRDSCAWALKIGLAHGFKRVGEVLVEAMAILEVDLDRASRGRWPNMGCERGFNRRSGQPAERLRWLLTSFQAPLRFDLSGVDRWQLDSHPGDKKTAQATSRFVQYTKPPIREAAANK
jgi:hypothetical protein